MKRASVWVILTLVFVVAGLYAATRDWRGERVQPDQQGVQSDQRAGESAAGKNAAASDTSPAEGARERQIKGSAQSGELTAEQREKIRSYVSSHREGRLEQADFTLMVGSGVPQQIPLADLPVELSDALGGYTGNKYVVVRDKMAIVDPEVRRIVAVIPDVQ
jgi:Protein of unknown function (DUF1236)